MLGINIIAIVINPAYANPTEATATAAAAGHWLPLKIPLKRTYLKEKQTKVQGTVLAKGRLPTR